eukprot:TRINITY_DN90783_c0_g1_i1.p1 TRINITY_DN90783_c0_g1~~TRINITY_DN90783_c0_g1_i1.p1  ORF type:complete len:954 (+),score=133.20 TRINITY_DN90783_c0_g1_i1:93-2954(+)
MVDVDHDLKLDSFVKLNCSAHTRKTEAKFDELVKEAKDAKVEVTELLKSKDYQDWTEFGASCEPFPLTCGLMELAELGSGQVLYFYFLRFMLAVLLLFTVIQLPALASYALAGDMETMETWVDPDIACSTPWRGDDKLLPEMCEQLTEKNQTVTVSWMSRLSPASLGPKGDGSAIVPIFYTIGFWLLSMLLIFMYAFANQIDEQADMGSSSPNDFAVLVEGLPPTVKDESSVKNFFRLNAVEDRGDVEVVKVVIGWDIQEYERTSEELSKLRKKQKKLKDGSSEIASLNSSVKELERKLTLHDGGFGELKSSGIAIVVFRKQLDQVLCLDRWEGFIQRWFYCEPSTGGFCSALVAAICSQRKVLPKFEVPGNAGYKIKVSRAPNSSDINWRDVGRSQSEKWCRKALTLGALLLLLIISFVTTWQLTKVSKVKDTPKLEMTTAYVTNMTLQSFLPATAITVINVLMMLAARIFGEREYHFTKTQESASISNYMTVAMLINSAVVLWAISRPPSFWYTAPGLVSDAYAMLAVNFVCPPLMFLMDYEYVYKRFMRPRLTEDKIQKINDTMNKYRGSEEPDDIDALREVHDEVRQWEAYFIPTPMDMPRHYANAEKTFFCCLLFMPLAPLAPLVGFFTLVLQYVNDKWMLLRWCRRPSVMENAAACKQALDRSRYVLPWLLPFLQFFALRPSFNKAGALNASLACSLLPAVVIVCVPIKTLSAWASCAFRIFGSRVKRGSVSDSTVQDYYEAQYLWPKEGKYHKSHFVYAGLSESDNPEFLTPETGEIEVEHIRKHVRRGDVRRSGRHRRGSHGRGSAPPGRNKYYRKGRHEPREPHTGGKEPPTATVHVGAAEPPMGTLVGAVAHSTAVMPEVPHIPGSSESYTWMFEVQGGYKDFDDDSQSKMEELYEAYCAGRGESRVAVSSGDHNLSIDFQRMTSMVVGGSGRVRSIRRVSKS